MFSEQDLFNRFANIRVWKRGDQRAPHKPLLILFMLGRVQRMEPRMISYAEAMEPLQRLLDDFGPPRRSTPAYPFYHLSNDGIWELSVMGSISIVGSPSDRFLLDNNVSGGFSEDVYSTLIDNHSLISAIARSVLKQSFPDSLHTEILQAAGLDIEAVGVEAGVLSMPRPRDSAFRERILVAYSFSCAVCGFNVWLGRLPVGLEAAHIKWHQAGGPDQEDNGLLLCTLHHKLFDRGVFSIDHNLKVKVSETAHGGEGFEQWLARFHGQSIRIPERPQYKPSENYINWHIREVFRGPEKYSAG
ncbi:MAG: HNH endonuclease [Bacillota bacterium]|nr:HNH endonuclease [Bacillota bacterium]